MSIITRPHGRSATEEEPTPAPARWALPEPVEPPSRRRVDAVARRISDALGMYPAGWTVLAVAVLAAIGGWLLHWAELKLAAVMGILLVVVAVLFTIGRKKFFVSLRLTDEHVVVGEPAGGELQVHNIAARRTLPSRIDLPVGRQVASFLLPSLASQQVHTDEFVIPTDRRGVVLVGPARSVQGDPFSLTGRETRWTDAVELFVHPRTVGLPGRQSGFVHDLEGHASANLSSSDMSFHALREYEPGDDRRHVHWKSTAKTGQLMVRQYEETRQSHLALGLDCAEASYVADDEFETAVSVAGSVALQAIREENPLTVCTNRAEVPAISGRRVLDELSRVELASRPTLFELVETLRARQGAASIIVLVTGSVPTLDKIRQACATFDVDARVIAVQIDPSKLPAVRGVANITITRIRSLEELPRAVRKAMQ